MHCVAETQPFRRAADKAGMTEDEINRLKVFLSENPDAGDLIVGTGGARKLRFAKPGGGKSSGYRVITYYVADDIPIFLMDVYAKGERVSLSAADKNEFRNALSSFADDYRETMKRKVTEMKRSEVAS
jgi:hypothetical protein